MGPYTSFLPLLTVTALALSSHASAQVDASASSNLPGEANGKSAALSDTADALPGVHRIGVAGVKGPRASASVHALYGFTEAQDGGAGPHHRAGGSLAASFAPWSFAALAVRADFRHDIHPSDALGSDSGSVLDITPLLRLGTEIGDGIHLGVEGRVLLPGATVGEQGGPDPQVDARALAAYSGIPSWLFALHAGYRLGIRGGIIDESALMRSGDRVALGLSEYDALLLGLGAVKVVSKTEILGEVTTEMLLGSGAPGFMESPLRGALGARHPLAKHLWLSALLEASLGARAPSAPGDPLVPVEPRVQGMLGLIWRFLTPPEPAPPAEVKSGEEKKAEITPEPEKDPVDPGPAPVVTSTVRVTVVDSKNHPISDAEVTIETPASEGGVPVPLESRNTYVLSDVPVGEIEIRVRAELLKPHAEAVTLKEGEATEIAVKLQPADTLGSQLRGLVRSYSGAGVKASVRVVPGDHQTICGEDGSFELDLPPGTYQVIIEAEGYRSQRRTLHVRKEGVTVLNADLQEGTN